MVGIPWVQYKLDHLRVWMTLTQITLASVVVILIVLGIMTFDRINKIEDKIDDENFIYPRKPDRKKGPSDEFIDA